MAADKKLDSKEPLGEGAVYERVVQRIGPLSASPVIGEEPRLVVVISGSSGVGKDSVVRALQEKRPNLHFVVTATSRQPPCRQLMSSRVLPSQGVPARETFEEWIANDRMFEYALVYGDYKGVPKSQIEQALEKGQDCILRLDVQGAAYVKKMHPHCITIFISPCSEEELVKRLISRKTESLEDMVVRVETARDELRRAAEFDYVVVNEQDRMEAAVMRISSILDAEKSKLSRLSLSA